jgi:outer membrane protein assembly factor BamB
MTGMRRLGLVLIPLLAVASGACDDDLPEGPAVDAGEVPDADGGDDRDGTQEDMPGDVDEGLASTVNDRCVLTPAASLPGGFEVLFRKQITPNSAWLNGSVVATADRLALSDAYALHFLDRQANQVALFNRFSSARMSAPVTDESGTIYVVADGSAWAFDGNGSMKWSAPVGPRGGEHDFHKTPLVGPTLLVSAEITGSVVAIDKASGQRLWTTNIPKVWMPGLGLGEAVAVVMREGSHSPVLDARTGSVRFHMGSGGGLGVGAYGAASGFGLMAAETGPGGRTNTTVLDADGRPRFALPAPRNEQHLIAPRYVDLDGWLVVSDDPDGNVASGFTLRRFDRAGHEGPSNTVVLNAGPGYLRSVLHAADGHTYFIVARSGGGGWDGVDIYAFDRDFVEVFRHSLAGVGQFTAGGTPCALAGDGVLYVLAEGPGPTTFSIFNLVAIKTPSPGVARTGWAGLPSDQAAGGWAD